MACPDDGCGNEALASGVADGESGVDGDKVDAEVRGG